MAHWAYMLKCSDGSYYSGYSTDPRRREREHNAGRGARYTRSRRPVALVYAEELEDKGSALKREAALKKLSHVEKERLAEEYAGRS